MTTRTPRPWYTRAALSMARALSWCVALVVMLAAGFLALTWGMHGLILVLRAIP